VRCAARKMRRFDRTRSPQGIPNCNVPLRKRLQRDQDGTFGWPGDHHPRRLVHHHRRFCGRFIRSIRCKLNSEPRIIVVVGGVQVKVIRGDGIGGGMQTKLGKIGGVTLVALSLYSDTHKSSLIRYDTSQPHGRSMNGYRSDSTR
jgi:hypothetical protein